MAKNPIQSEAVDVPLASAPNIQTPKRYWMGLRPNPFVEQIVIASRDVGRWTEDVGPDPRNPMDTIRTPRLGRVVELTDSEVERIRAGARQIVVRPGAMPLLIDKIHPIYPVNGQEIPLSMIVYLVPFPDDRERLKEPEPIDALSEVGQKALETQREIFRRVIDGGKAKVVATERNPIICDM